VIKGIQLLHTADLDEVLDTLAALRGGTPAPAPVRTVPRAAAPKPAAPVAAKPATVAAPAKPAAVAAPAPVEDARAVWRGIVGEVISRNPLRSAWLDAAGEVAEEDGALRVVFPRDQDKQLKTPHAKEQGKLIEELWKQTTGRAVVFRPEATGEVVAATGSAASVPTADDFENDAGIEAAIELFGATLEPEEKS
jgi:hypothetical protein